MVDQLGSPNTYSHYPTGWAMAFSTPYRMFKRYTYQGGVCDPLVIHWPAGIASKGEVRDQYHHSTDIVPTILDVCGVEMPETYNGATQNPLHGVSMRYSFDAVEAPTEKHTQYYEMLGSRAIWHRRAGRPSPSTVRRRRRNFDAGSVAAASTPTIDRAEANDLADQHPTRSTS